MTGDVATDALRSAIAGDVADAFILLTEHVTEVCGPCEHEAEHGWWGKDHQGTHCRGCHRSWRGKAESHCAACHESFGSVSSFDIHVKHCTRDPLTAQESLHGVLRDDGTPRLALQDRKGGAVWVSWRSEGNPYA